MPDEIAEPKIVRPPGGKHTSATMKALLAKKVAVTGSNGETKHIPATGVIFAGQIITDPKEVPSDEEIEAHRKDVLARRQPQ